MTCLLHDIGTTDTNLNATRLSFEFYGGLLTLDVLKEFGASKSQAESVAEAIIRHQDLGETGMITSVGQLIQLATVFGELRPFSLLPIYNSLCTLYFLSANHKHRSAFPRRSVGSK